MRISFPGMLRELLEQRRRDGFGVVVNSRLARFFEPQRATISRFRLPLLHVLHNLNQTFANRNVRDLRIRYGEAYLFDACESRGMCLRGLLVLIDEGEEVGEMGKDERGSKK